jgi:O-antigen ligase
MLVVVAAARSSGERIPLPGRAIPLSIAAWALWSTASALWSVDRAFSLHELKGDIAWGVVTMAIFYVAAALRGGFAMLSGTALAGLAFWTALAIGLSLSATGWDLKPFHRGEGAFATYLVTIAPFVALLLWRPPLGFATGVRSLLVTIGLIGLVLYAARMSDNRILWIAFAASLLIVAACTRTRGFTLAKGAFVALLVVAFAALFADASSDRAERVPSAEKSVSANLATDPRLAIWKHAKERISERPWLGYGYGLHILGREIGADTGDAKIRHPHTVFGSQWLQTGGIGAGLFVLMLGSVAWRFGRFVRSGDDEVSRLGAIGLAVLAAFTIRNLTDDFLIRASGKLLFAACAMILGAAALRLQMRRVTGPD